jgi:hypothetical protein
LADFDDSARLALWERISDEHPLDRALSILEALGGGPRDELARLPLDQRDRRLYAAAADLFGPRVAVSAHCPDCRAETEVGFTVAEVLALPPADPRPTVGWQGRSIAYRPPDSRDLAAALRAGSDGRAVLLRRLVGDEAAEELLDVVEADLAARAGPEAMTLAFGCTGCGREMVEPFDILDYLWRRLVAQAHRLLRDIHIIASAYGWTTAEILSLGAARRATHVAMIGP